MQKFTITIENTPDLPDLNIIHFDGDFDGYAKENLIEIQNVIDNCEPKTTLIFDFSKLNYLNSYAIGHLVAWHNHLSKLEGRIFITGTNKNVEDIFAILGISSLFKIYPDTQSAIEALKTEN